MPLSNSISVPDKMLRDHGINPKNVYFMELSTNGFAPIGLKENDLVLVEKNAAVPNGSLVEVAIKGERFARIFYQSDKYNIFVKFDDANQIEVFEDTDNSFKILGKIQALLNQENLGREQARIDFITDKIFHQGNAWW